MANIKRKKWIKVIIASILLLFIASGIYGYSVYKSMTDAVETMHQPIKRERSEKRPAPIVLEEKEPFSVLMLGVDEREGDRGRSDTIIVLSVNPNSNSVKMLSIPRDTRTEIVGKGFEDKINHAYAFGGVEMSMNTVENFLDVPIDYYLQINMEGFKDIVDAVGGVSVNNSLDFRYDGTHFPVGEIMLNGREALSFSRMRYEDPRGDFGRQTRQRQVIQGVIKKGASFSSLTNYDDIFEALGNNIKTNLEFKEMVGIQQNYREAGKNIEQMELTGKGTMINNIYYFAVPEEEKLRVQSEFKNHLELM